MREKRYGQPPRPEDSYDDIADIARIVSLPDDAIHRDVDKIVLGAASPSVRTAIVCPPTISGLGRGPGNTRSMQVYALVEAALKAEGVVQVIGEGKAEWDHVHVGDLADVFVRLVEASRDEKLAGSEEVFGEKAYYFAEDGAFAWGDVSKCEFLPLSLPIWSFRAAPERTGECETSKLTWHIGVADELVKQGFAAKPTVTEVTAEQAIRDSGFVAGSWGLNSKSHANRARKFLNWKATRSGLKGLIPEIVASEAARLGIKPQAA